MRVLAVALALGAACAAPAAPNLPEGYATAPVLNPRLADGRTVYRAFGDHHPECFVFVDEAKTPDSDTETVPCPQGAVHELASCPAGRLHRASDGCVCVPIEGEPEAVRCPR